MDKKKFYDSAAWKHTREKQLIRDHYECQRCKHMGKYASVQGPKKYTKAVLVHHDFRFLRYPQYATMAVVNGKRNLYSLCQNCHEIEHEDERGFVHGEEEDFNEERW